MPDPHYGGGGLHQIRAGGFLKVHADVNRHHRPRLDRRLNGLLYQAIKRWVPPAIVDLMNHRR